MAVAITDYEGLGTPTVHTYLNPVAEAHANIDAVRAAQRLPGAGIPARGPVAFVGFSQGGGAAAGTAEQLASYGPELDVAGVYAGAPPRNIPGLFRYLDGGSFAGVIGYFLNGLAAAFPETDMILSSELNASGQILRARTADECALETIADFGFQPSTGWTLSGQSIPDMLDANPRLAEIDRQLELGHRGPSVPVLVGTSDVDDVVPPDEVLQLAADWCAKGATVELYDAPLRSLPVGTGAGHFTDAGFLYLTKVRSWLQDRFAGVPASNQCQQLP